MMTKMRFPFHRFSIPLGLILLMSACGDSASTTDSIAYKMGDKVPVGTMIYSVLEAEWKTDLSAVEGLPQTPQNRFLVLKVSITNSGGAQMAIPLLTLENPKKESSMEVSDVRNLPNWLGLVRLVNPASTETGYIVFDVPTSAYKLRVTDGKESGADTTRLIDIPLSLNEPTR